MQTQLATSRTYPGGSRLLYTAVLYDSVPESSAPSSVGEPGACSAYLKRLTREHLARASMEEIESLGSGSPDPESRERIVQLTEKVKKAYAESNGNPADGRWSFVSDLLRLNTTRGGRRWLGTRTDEKTSRVFKQAAIIPKSDKEWHEMERKWEEQESVKHKVQHWITTAEFEPLTPETTAIQEQSLNQDNASRRAPSKLVEKHGSRKPHVQHTLKAISNEDDLFSTARPMFTVVKRTNAVVRDKPKPRQGRSPMSPYPRHADSDKQLNASADIAPATNATSRDDHQIKQSFQVDVSGDTFRPPSLSSHVEASAPPAPHDNHAEGLAPNASSASLPSPTSLRVTKISDTSRNLPTSPPSNSHTHESSSFSSRLDAVQPVIGVSRKRARSGSPRQQLVTKRYRSDEPLLPSAPHDLHDQSAIPAPTTPPRKNLPRLTELLASNKRESRTLTKSVSAPKAQTDTMPPPRIPSDPSTHRIPPRISAEPGAGETAPAVGGSEIQPSDVIKGPIPNSAGIFSPSFFSSFSMSGAQPSDPSPAIAPDPALGLDPESKEPSTDASPIIEDVLAVQESQSRTSLPTGSPETRPLRFPSPEDESPQLEGEVIPYNLYGLDTISPTKSLSSLAGSDSPSEQGDDEEQGEELNVDSLLAVPRVSDSANNFEFDPQFTSTQKLVVDGGGGDLRGAGFSLSPDLDSGDLNLRVGLGWGHEKVHSTSQLQAEVNSQVDEFDKFMEADLSYDLAATGP